MIRRISVILLLCALAAGPAVADTIDQQSGFTSGFSGLSLGSGGFLAQTFTAGVTATFSGVSIGTFGFGGPYSLAIYDTVGGLPGTTLLASTSVGGGNSYGGQIVFPTGFTQIAGTTYAIVLQIGSGSPAWILAGTGDQYAGGAGYYSFDGVNWNHLNTASSAHDFTFETYVSPVPEPATLLLLGSGLIPLAWLRRRGRR